MARWNVYDRLPAGSPPNSPCLGRSSVLSLEEIDHMTYRQGVRHLKDLKMRTRDLKSPEDVKDFLRCLYHPDQVPQVDNTDDLKNLKAQTEELRAQQSQLAAICDLIEEKFSEKRNPRVADVIKDMDAGLSSSWKQNLAKLKKVLCSHKTPVLVAGETGSGKSSLINLLINKQLLPEATHPCTASICVIKNNERSFVQLRRSKTDCQEIDMSENSMWLDFVRDRSGLESEDPESFFCRRAVFHTPLPQFHPGTFFVDSPGFREWPMLTQVLLKYMPKASAFVIVLRTDELYGLNEPVKDFIINIRRKLNDFSLKTMDNEVSLDNVSNITVDNVIFVFNRWDVIVEDPKKPAEEIRQTCLKTLSDLWPYVKEDENVFFLSVTKNFAKVSQNVAPDPNFVKLQTAVFSLIPKSHDSRISTAYMWLEQLTRRLASVARSKINMAKLSGDEKANQHRRLHDALEKARRAGAPILSDLRAAIDARHDKFLQSMLNHLRSEEALQRMCAFEQDEKVYGVRSTEVNFLPDRDSFSELWPALHAFFMQRVWREVLFWNEAPARSYNSETGEISVAADSTRFAAFNAELRALVADKMAEIDAEANVLRALLDKGGEESAVASARHEGLQQAAPFGTVERALFGITAIIWVPLAVVGSVISLPIMAGILARNKFEGNLKLRKYREDKAGVAAALLTNFVRFSVTEELLKHPMDMHIKVSAVKAQAERYFPAVISEFEARITRLTEDERSQQEISASFQPLLEDARLALSHLYFFAASHLHLFPFCEQHFSSLDTWRAPAGGDFCVTVLDSCRALERPRCAVKIVRDPISSDNAYRVFREEQAWRKLCKFQHLNIVLFYGLVSFGSPKRVGFVMERCDGNLADLVLTSEGLAPFALTPSSTAKEAAFHRTAAMGLQIATALSFIHQNNYIHRSLVMETVSVFRNGPSLVLKLSDFGLSRAGEDVTTTVAGGLVYLSPEVLHSRGWAAASDVYAFGLLLWEIYHGERVLSWLPARERSIDALKELCAGGKVVPPFKDAAAPDCYQSLTAACVQTQPAMRPPMNQVFDALKLIAGSDEVVL